MVFIVSYMLGSVKTYAAMENLETQTNETNHQNVSFKAYFLEEPNKEVHSGELDINSAKDLYFQMEVKECDENSVVSVYYADEILVARTIRHGFDLETFIITACFAAYIVLFMKWLSKLFNQGNRG